VFLRVKDKVIKGNVIVCRKPYIHRGDIRKVKAVPNERLADSGINNVLLFPTRGNRCVPGECAGGDLDGDQFVVIWDNEIVSGIEDASAMAYDGIPKEKYEEPKGNITVGVSYLAARNSSVGRLYNMYVCMCAYSEDGPNSPLALALAMAYSIAIDAPKSGRDPLIPKKALALQEKYGFPQYSKSTSTHKFHCQNTFGKRYDEVTTQYQITPLEPLDLAQNHNNHDSGIDEQDRAELRNIATMVDEALADFQIKDVNELLLGGAPGNFIEKATRTKQIREYANICVELSNAFAEASNGDADPNGRANHWYKEAASMAKLHAFRWVLPCAKEVLKSNSENHTKNLGAENQPRKKLPQYPPDDVDVDAMPSTDLKDWIPLSTIYASK
jgi:hypothetical protein